MNAPAGDGAVGGGAVVVLSRKPLRQRPIHEWLDGATEGVWLVTTKAALEGCGPEVTGAYAGLATVEDYRSWDVELRAEELARRAGAALVASSSEDDVLRAARLRRRLGLPGQSVASALAYRDKVVMKEAAQAAGIAVPAFAAVDSPLDLLAFVDAHGFPVVVKPRRGAGSEGVRIVEDRAGLDDLLASGALPAAPEQVGRLMVEAFVAGAFHHVDGIAAGGRVVHGWPSRYSSGNAQAVHGARPLTSHLLGADDPDRAALDDLTRRVVAALPSPPLPTSFHLEAWLTPTGPVLCEVATRTGGAFVADTYERAFGVHLSRESLRGQAGAALALDRQPGGPRRYAGWVALTPGPGTFHPPPLPCPVDGVSVDLRLAAGESAPATVHAGDSVARVVVEGEGPGDVRDRIDAVVAWWEASEPWR